MTVISALKIRENTVAYSLFNNYPVFILFMRNKCNSYGLQSIFLAVIAVLCICSGASANSIFYNLMLQIWDGDVFVVWLLLFII